MKEEFLHYVWQHQQFVSLPIKTTSHKRIQVQYPGAYNTNSGPDFLNAKIVIDDILWVGHVEIHVKSSDWYVHKHEEDISYDTVILHMVWDDDVEVFRKDNKQIDTLEVATYINKSTLKNYLMLSSNTACWIPCQNLLTAVDAFTINQWKESLFFERLEQKTTLIHQLLNKSNNDFEAVLFVLLAKSFGLKVNAEAFLRLATSVDFSVVRKERSTGIGLSALLFGQAGFLEETIEDPYFICLKNEYAYQRHKYQLQPIGKNHFKFFRLRPSNFPTVRIAQLAALYSNYEQLFSKLLNVNNLNDFYELFKYALPPFWDTHFTFQKSSKKRKKKITKQFVDLLIINAIIPLKFVYLKSRGEVFEESLLNLAIQLKPEINSIISKFLELGFTAKNAFDTQALLQLKNNYCAKKRCLQCAIGNSILRNANTSS
ncbi:MAG: DUF2851 family protein [Flavobacteriaceae bacterium]|nr:DUF2851 family protein [Flavobacteriaceae bacterium]